MTEVSKIFPESENRNWTNVGSAQILRTDATIWFVSFRRRLYIELKKLSTRHSAKWPNLGQIS